MWMIPEKRFLRRRFFMTAPTICSTEKRFFFIGKILNPLRAQFWPKTNICRGSKYPGPITTLYPYPNASPALASANSHAYRATPI
jgi:hypothetical protein